MTRKTITRAIWLLSLVSFLADLSSQMLYPIMPVYLKSVGFSVALIGLLEGVAEATAGLSKGYFGRLSDHSGQRLPFVRLGYTLSALSKPLMALFALPGWIFTARTLDRLGKGLRTAARDALLADESNRQTRGQVFGFHRSMDTFGAVLGPVAALVYLYYFPAQYATLFLLAFGPGMLSVGLTFLLKERTPQPDRQQTGTPARSPSIFGFLHYWRTSPPEYRRVVGGLLAFALFNSSDVFLLLKIKEAGLSDTAVIGLYVFYNLIYALSAYPVGRLADRIGLKPTLLVGLGLFALVYEGMVVANQLFVFVGLLALYGLYAAATEGIAKAWISTISGPKDTATAIGTYAGLSSLCALVANALTGWLWYTFGAAIPFALTGAATLAVIVYLVAIEGRRVETRPLPPLLTVPHGEDGMESEMELADYASDGKSTVTMSRSAFVAIILLIACLGIWTVYMSFLTVSTTLRSTTNQTASESGKSGSDPATKVRRRSGPEPPLNADSKQGNSITGLNGTASDQPVMVDLLAAKRRAAAMLGQPVKTDQVKLPAEPLARRVPTRTARSRRRSVRQYTLAGVYTHFYDRPTERSRRRAFVNVLRKRVVVTPLAERNGFFYVVYNTRKGQRIGGWISRRTLRPVAVKTGANRGAKRR